MIPKFKGRHRRKTEAMLENMRTRGFCGDPPRVLPPLKVTLPCVSRAAALATRSLPASAARTSILTAGLPVDVGRCRGESAGANSSWCSTSAAAGRCQLAELLDLGRGERRPLPARRAGARPRPPQPPAAASSSSWCSTSAAATALASWCSTSAAAASAQRRPDQPRVRQPSRAEPSVYSVERPCKTPRRYAD